MDSLDLQVLTQARDWRAQGRGVWLVTVIETWGSAPRPPGALLAMCDDGQVAGSVSGGCVEDDLIERVRHGERVGKPSLVTYGVTKEEAARFGLPCGGNLRLVQEPLGDTAWISEVLERTARHELVARRLDLDTGSVTIEPASRGEAFVFDGKSLRALFGPRWRLLIIGAGQLSRTVAQMALALDFEVICCDPREEYHLTWDIPNTTFSKAMPDDLVQELQLDPHSAVIAVTHDPKLDDMVLLEALKSPAFYVGALGSRGNTAKRKDRLALFDLSAAEIGRLHGPIGLDLGSKTPAEIAVSIVAEIVAVKNGVSLTQKKEGSAVPQALCVAGGGGAAAR
jgi:xanthine dehydrogenase accessory factor